MVLNCEPKLSALLEITHTNAHDNEDCCESDLTDDELILLDRCFEVSDEITTEVKSALYYISGYVAMKEGIGLDDPQIQNSEISDFTTKVSRGLLKHPPVQLLELPFYLYAYYDAVEMKVCATRLLKAFTQIYEVTHNEFENYSCILHCYVHCFSEGSANQQTQKIKDKATNRKR